ncbi:hypothetical protein [Calycomorphotria hydatis]|uniref:Carboxypeptidase regulatory-like domain-containing protein n=1 Tax=Calycomorphotria hydatis TaxID=2528027 RepID=A0A517TAM5_9PLAN|nr:hypothetical protein [Calycomorphotria hydatis]QDT65425.1 hypothetical protein V22_26780 [Calycomorphotria hydatis]
MFIKALSTNLVLLAVIAAAGCSGSDGPERGDVVGAITFEGEPLPAGVIHFEPDNGAPVIVKVTDGKYRTDSSHGAVTGRNVVKITATKKTGKQIKNIMGEMEDEYIQYIPKSFNEETTLEVEVSPGHNNFDFNLTAE